MSSEEKRSFESFENEYSCFDIRGSGPRLIDMPSSVMIVFPTVNLD